MDHNNQVNIVCNFVAEKTFSLLKDLKTLELGPLDGWFTEQLLKYTSDVTVIELGKGVCELLSEKFNDQVKIIDDDFHYAITNVGVFDAVVMFGVLYHSVSPFKLIEDTVNFCKPKYILLDCGGSDPNQPLLWGVEHSKQKGSRQYRNRSSGIVIDPGISSIKTAMSNLEYQLTEQIDLTETELSQIPNWDFKQGFKVLVFKDTHL